MKRILYSILFVFLSITSFAQPDWTPVNYTNSTTAYGIVTINGQPAETPDMVGAFAGSECRAKQEVVVNGGIAYVTLIIQGEVVEDVSFKVWDADQDIICDVSFTTQTDPDGTIGYPPNFLPIDATCGVNTAPIVSDIPDQSVAEGSTFSTINLDDYVTDAETADEDIAWTWAGNVELSVNILARVATITIPDEDWYGSETITFRATDDDVSDPLYDEDAATFSVTPENDPPVITGQNTITVAEDNSLAITVSHLIIEDPDDTPAGMTVSVGSGTNYTVAGGNTITPSSNFNGTLTVPVKVNDGEDNSNTYDASVNVTAENDAPEITGQDDLSVDEDENLILTADDFTISDVDNPSGPFTLSVNDGNNYSVSGTTISPDLNYYGTLTVLVTVSDGSASSDVFHASVSVDPVNDLPVFTSTHITSATEGETYSYMLTAIDYDDDPLTWSATTLPDWLDFDISTHELSGSPENSDVGAHYVQINIDDEIDEVQTSFTITVANVNNAPEVSNIPDQGIAEGGTFADINLDNFVTDGETADENISWSYLGNSSLIVSIMNQVATISTPSPDWIGRETITFTATDDDPSEPLSDSDTATFTVTDLNDPPVVADIPDQTINEGEKFATINLDDYVSDSETMDANIDWSYSGNSNLLVNITNRIATITVADVNWYGNETVTFTATDEDKAVPLAASDAVLFTVMNINDPPEINGQQTISVFEDNTLTIQLSQLNVTDIDNQQSDLSLHIQRGDHYLMLTNGSIVPDVNYNGNLNVNLVVYDLTSSSDLFAALVTVNPVNDQPVIIPIPDQEITIGSSFTDINLDDYIYDVETSDELITWTYSENTQLEVSILNRTAHIIMPHENWIGSDTIAFNATDNDTMAPLTVCDTVVFTVTAGTGIAPYKSLNTKVYPNPSEGLFDIELSEVLQGEILLQVFTIQGELVMNSKQKMLDDHLELNIKNQPSGYYFIRLISPDFIETIEIIKQ